MSVNDRSQVEQRSYICARHAVCNVSATVVGTQGEFSHVARGE